MKILLLVFASMVLAVATIAPPVFQDYPEDPEPICYPPDICRTA